MPATFVSAAVAVLSLASAASASYTPAIYRRAGFNSTGSASPTGGNTITYPNGTSVTATPNTVGGNGTFTTYEDLICPLYNDEVLLVNPQSQWLIECGTTALGTVIAVKKAKRQEAITGVEWLVDCVQQCDAMTGCVGTGYNIPQSTCTFYSSIDSTYADPDVDFAIVAQPDSPAASSAAGTVALSALPTSAGQSSGRQSLASSAGQSSGVQASAVQMTTSTVYTTKTSTITSCASTVTNCPARTVTEVISLYTTVCPVSDAATATTTQAAVVCTACAYTTSMATVFSINTAGSKISVVPVTTQAVVVPILAAKPVTTVTAVVSSTTTFCPSSSSTATATATASVSPSTYNKGTTAATLATVSGTSTRTSMVMFTGAANKNAGMGLAAAIAGAAALII